MDKKKPTIIKNPSKRYWPGDSRVEKFMLPVKAAIQRHIKWPSQEFIDIYNRAYEAVYNAIEATAKEALAVQQSIDGKETVSFKIDGGAE